MKEELVRKEYVGKVTSKDLYNLLGASALRNNELAVYIDGVADNSVNSDVFDVTELTRAGTNAVGKTGNGVLTQVFVDSSEELITVSIINTYLARATTNYNAKQESLPLKVYNVDVDAKNNIIKKAQDDSVTAYSEDYALVESAKKDDFFLVTLADGKVQSIVKAPTVDNVTLNSFKEKDWVNAEGTKYEYASTARYDVDVLNQYDKNNMKNTTYKLYLDQYDNLIGIEIVEEELNYVFITGYEAFSSKLGKADAEAFGIFPDGTSKTITVKDAQDVKTAGNNPWDSDGEAAINQWYTYTTDKNGDYTLGRIPYALGTGKVAQGWDKGEKSTTIDKSHVSLSGQNNAADQFGERAYGNNETVYLLADEGTNADSNPIIKGVDSMTIGVNNVDIKVKTPGYALAGSVYLYNDKGYIIAAVVAGEDNGSEKSYAFILDSKPTQEDYDKENEEWTWYRKAIVNGQEVQLKEKGSKLTYLGNASGNGNMGQYKWFRVSYDKDGYVVGTSSKSNTAATWNDKTPVDFAASDNAEAIYVGSTVYFNTWTSFDADKVALIYQEMNTRDSKLGLTLDGFTLYAYDDRDTADTGIHLKRDCNAVLIETDVDGDRVIRYFDDGDGHDNVDAALNAMKKDANGKNKFNGTVYYVMKDGETTTIIIVDDDAQTSEGIEGPSNKKVTGMAYGNGGVWAHDKNNIGVPGAVISLYILKDEGYVKVGDFTTGATGDTPTLPTVAGNTYKAVCGGVELLFTT